MKRKGIVAAVAAWTACAAMGGQAAHAPQTAARCVAPEQASGLALVLLPGALKAAQRVCTGVLPETALLRRLPASFLGKYERAATGAWPRASSAIAAISGTSLGDAELAMVRPMIDAMAAPALAGVVQPQDCASAKQIVTMLEPLPPENLAGVVVAILQMRSAAKAREAAADGATGTADGGFKLDICPPAN